MDISNGSSNSNPTPVRMTVEETTTSRSTAPTPTHSEGLLLIPAPQTPQRRRPVAAPTTITTQASSPAVPSFLRKTAPTTPVHSPPRSQTQSFHSQSHSTKEDEDSALAAQTLSSLSVHQRNNSNSSALYSVHSATSMEDPNNIANDDCCSMASGNNISMGMRGGCPSPAHSHVSTGSFQQQQQRYDLTPITRNTSLTTLFMDANNITNSSGTGTGCRGVPITPPHYRNDSSDGGLHGEHLTLPSADDDDELLNSETAAAAPPSILASASLLRRSSHREGGVDVPFTLMPSSTITTEQPFLAPGLPQHRNESPVPLQSHRKFHTFTSREQYNAGIFQQPRIADDDDTFFQASSDDEDDTHIHRLRQYAPRHRLLDDDDDDDETDGELEGGCRRGVDAIFKEDDRIPLEQVPSLRMAHALYGGGSTTSLSYTGGEETDEDSLVHMVGGGSCSFQFDDSFPGGMQYDEEIDIATSSHRRDSYHRQPPRMQHDESNLAQEQQDQATVLPLPPKLNRRKRKPRREEEARAWLQEIQGDADCVAEAASSVFLRQQPIVGAVPPKASLRRQISAPLS